MHYLYEAIFIGVYSVILYVPIHLFYEKVFEKPHIYLMLGVFGLCKHLVGYIVQLHNYYCNYGDACLNMFTNTARVELHYNEDYLLLESILEALYYALLGYIFIHIFGINWHHTLTHSIFFIFMAGIFTHTLAELIGLHKYMCIYRCKIDPTTANTFMQ